MKTEWAYSLDFTDPKSGAAKGGEFCGGDTRRECIRRLVRSLRHHRQNGIAEGRFVITGELREVCATCHGEGSVPKYRKKGFSVLRKPRQSCKKVKDWYLRSFTVSANSITLQEYHAENHTV